MNHESLDRILAHEEHLVPSSGFVSSVMERIHEEAAVPPPLPFPWKRAVPGLISAGGVLMWGGFALVRYGLPALRSSEPVSVHLPAAVIGAAHGALWVALALGVSLASWLLARFFVADRGFL
jgi:hypothetical protein